jgi:hypothetical protein
VRMQWCRSMRYIWCHINSTKHSAIPFSEANTSSYLVLGQCSCTRTRKRTYCEELSFEYLTAGDEKSPDQYKVRSDNQTRNKNCWNV